MTDGYMVPTGQMDTRMGDGWVVLAGRASRVCWTLPVAPGAHRGGETRVKGAGGRESGVGAQWVREGEVLMEQRRQTRGRRRGPG